MNSLVLVPLITPPNSSDTTGSESTPVSKDAPAIPTPVITPTVAPPATPAQEPAGGESEEAAAQEEASISLQPPTEQVESFEFLLSCFHEMKRAMLGA